MNNLSAWRHDDELVHIEDELRMEGIETMLINRTGAPYVETYTNFIICCLTPEQHEQTCGYWYTVTSRATSHTAFATSDGLLAWLDERGLHLTDTLPEERGTFKVIRVEGTYHSASYLNVDAFLAIEPLRKIAVMSNAHYTLGKVTEEEGVRTVHYLNVNIHERIDFPYFEVRDGILDPQIIQDSPDIQEVNHTFPVDFYEF